MLKNYITKLVLELLDKEIYEYFNPSVKIAYKPMAKMIRATEHSAGFDLFNNSVNRVLIEPGQRQLIPTGISMTLPEGVECQVRPTSGNALKLGITVLNTPGTIDADFPGEIGVILINHGSIAIEIMPEQKIAQLVFARHCVPSFHRVDAIEITTSRKGGFGSTEK